MDRKSSWLRKLSVLLMVFAIVFTYSVVPMNQSFAASAKKPKKITVKADTKVVDIKGKATIKVTKVTPKGASTAVKYKSSKKKIATVSKKGVVTGKKKGTVKITVTSKKNKKAKKVIKIKVKDLKPSKLTLSTTSAQLEPGKTLALTSVASPKGVYAPVAWTSSNNAVATVSSSGVVTAKAAGSAVITVATTKAAGKIVKATCNVTVADPVNVVEKDPAVGAANTRTLTTDVDMSKYPEGQVVKVWLPIPQDDEYQTITGVEFSADKATKAEITTEKANGNKMLYVEWGKDVAAADRQASLTFTAKRYEVRRDPASIVEDPKATIPADVKAYISKESEYVKVNAPVVKETAAKITEGKTGTLEKAEAIYNWIIDNLERIDNGETLTLANGETHTYTVDGCGYGDTVRILTDFNELGRAGGHCTDLNSTFVALCRASGIPAREMFGIRMGTKANENCTTYQHCWAEFYVAGTGWVYADPADVLKAIKSGKGMTIDQVKEAKASDLCKEKTEFFWCGVDNNRVVLSRGRDITFEPAQAWGVCNTFGYPAAEVDGKRIETSFSDGANFVYTITSNEDRTIFVDTAYVKDAVSKGSEKTVIAEVSWGPDAPPELIPGAIHVNTDDLESNGQDVGYELWDLRGFNNNFKELGDALAKYGITKDSELICYGWGENNSGVTRLAMAALMMGVKDVKVLEGGTKAWFDAGFDKATAAAQPKSVESFGEPEHPEWVISTEDMLNKLESDDNFKLVSIRSYDEFIGKNSGYAYIDKAGEPLGAIWGHDTDDGSYFADGKFVGIDKINEYLKPYGASTENELAFYCGTGWRATIPFLICYEAGIDNMKLWDDGWYVYSGAYADSWNWPTPEAEGKLPEVKDYPVQIGDPAKGNVTETTVGDLEPIYNPLRGDIEAKAESVKLVPGVPSALGFNIMPAAKAGITNSVAFTSSDENIATVDAAGKVTIKDDAAAGSEATITATGNATFGSTPDKAGTQKTASYKVTVGKYVDLGADDWASLGIKYEGITEDDYLIDVRPENMFKAGHLAESVNSPVSNGYTEEQRVALKAEYDKAAGKRVVIVCVSGNMLAKNAFDALKASGADMSNVTFLIGGANGAKDHWVLDYVGMSDEEWAKYGITEEEITNADFLIDVRPASGNNSASVKGYVPGAVECPVGNPYSPEQKAAIAEAAKNAGDANIVIVCVSGNMLAKNAMAALAASGYDMSKVTYLIGGFGCWSKNFPVVAADKNSVSIPAWVANDEINMIQKDDGTYAKDLTHHVLVNKNGGNAKVAILNTNALALHLYNGLKEIGAEPSDNFNKADCVGEDGNKNVFLEDGSLIDVSFQFEKDGATVTKGMSDFLYHVATPTADVKKGAAVETEPYDAQMRFGGCYENIQNFFDSKSGNQTGCITCTFSCWIGTVSNSAYAYSTNESLVNRAEVPAKDTPVTVVYTLGE